MLAEGIIPESCEPVNFIGSLISISLHHKYVQEFNVQLFQLLDFSGTDVQPDARHHLLQLLADS